MKRGVLFMAAVFMLLFVAVVWAEGLPVAPTEAQVRIGTFGKPSAGDLIELTVRPPAGDSSAEPQMAEKLKSEPVEWGDGRILWWKIADPQTGEIKLGLTTYKPGVYDIAPIPFVKDGKTAFTTQRQSVTFEAIRGDKNEDSIYPPQAVGFPRWVWVALGTLTLGLVLGALWALKRWADARQSKSEELARAPRILTPLEQFERTRAEVDAKRLLESGQHKAHYFTLSEASKRFLGSSFRCDAEERTTRELTRELENAGMPVELIGGWEDLFEEMDVVKFTDLLPESNAALSLSARLSQAAAKSYRVSPAAREALLALPVKGGKR